MPLLYIFILALVQGITEFLPVSSSGHLVLVHSIFDPAEAGDAAWNSHMVLDIGVHIGTLLSVLLYFRKDVVMMFGGLAKAATGDTNHEGARLVFYVLLASIPVIAAGFVMHLMQPSWILQVEIVAWMTIIFGIVLWLADRTLDTSKTLSNMNIKDSIIIGLSQALALIPGTSRSGITMSAARFLGYSRAESAHFSLLLAMVAIGGAGALGIYEVYKQGIFIVGLDFLIAIAISFVSGLIAISLMMKWLERSSFMPFVIYRMILGSLLLVYVYVIV